MKGRKRERKEKPVVDEIKDLVAFLEHEGGDESELDWISDAPAVIDPSRRAKEKG